MQMAKQLMGQKCSPRRLLKEVSCLVGKGKAASTCGQAVMEDPVEVSKKG